MKNAEADQLEPQKQKQRMQRGIAHPVFCPRLRPCGGSKAMPEIQVGRRIRKHHFIIPDGGIPPISGGIQKQKSKDEPDPQRDSFQNGKHNYTNSTTPTVDIIKTVRKNGNTRMKNGGYPCCVANHGEAHRELWSLWKKTGLLGAEGYFHSRIR
ncbi:MAG: hypothetical protein WCJ07_06575 [Verrucomicrobiota bacterium]